MSQTLVDLDDLDCYLFYVQDLLENKNEEIGKEVIAQVKSLGDRFYEIAKDLKEEKKKR
jgi:hypothetical protein